jgi:hypothetical protein
MENADEININLSHKHTYQIYVIFQSSFINPYKRGGYFDDIQQFFSLVLRLIKKSSKKRLPKIQILFDCHNERYQDKLKWIFMEECR